MIHNIKKPFVLGAVFSVILAGCLKDKGLDNGSIQSTHGANIPVIGMAANVASTQNFALVAFDNGNNDTTVNLLPVSIGGSAPAGQDIHVTLEQNDQLVTNYSNNPDNASYIPPPAGSFTTSSVVTIPKGSYVGYLQIKFKPSDYIGQPYALGYKIKSIQEPGYTISGNLDTAICAIVIKNKYDGSYNMRMRLTGWGAYSISDGPAYDWPNKVGFSSTGGNTLIFSTTQGQGLQPGFTPGGGATVFGAATPQFTFDLTSNKLTDVTNLTADSRNRNFRLNPAVTDSRWDPATKTIYLAYIMGQNGRPDQFIYDTLTYVGSR
jgi:hypothetical protein